MFYCSHPFYHVWVLSRSLGTFSAIANKSLNPKSQRRGNVIQDQEVLGRIETYFRLQRLAHFGGYFCFRTTPPNAQGSLLVLKSGIFLVVFEGPWDAGVPIGPCARQVPYLLIISLASETCTLDPDAGNQRFNSALLSVFFQTCCSHWRPRANLGEAGDLCARVPRSSCRDCACQVLGHHSRSFGSHSMSSPINLGQESDQICPNIMA